MYDYIFAGFGLSGMTLFDELSKDSKFSKKKILIIDNSDKKQNDRTWSFWTDNSVNFYQHLASKSWDNALFYSRDNEQLDLKFNEYRYYSIESNNFYSYIKDKVNSYENITWVKDEIIDVKNEGVVVAKSDSFKGKLIFDSYYDKSKFKIEAHNVLVWQHFYGVFIETKENIFDNEKFVIMDYRSCNKKRNNFFYVLPFSNNYALIEFTEFSNEFYTEEEYKKNIERYIEAYYTKDGYSVKSIEMNSIPMTDYKDAVVNSKNVIKIGTKAGYIKPSSGYGFTRTIERTRKIAKLISKHNIVVEDKPNSILTPLFEMFDVTVLRLIFSRKIFIEELFYSLFKSLKPDFIFKFLDEKTNVFGFFRIMLQIPKKNLFIEFFLKVITSKYR